MLLNYDAEKDEITYKCSCGAILKKDCSFFISEINEELGLYNNFHFDCECGIIHALNMSIPYGEFEELDFEFFNMPFEEINARKYLRDFMWAKRVDLRKKDREAYNANYLKLLRS